MNIIGKDVDILGVVFVSFWLLLIVWIIMSFIQTVFDARRKKIEDGLLLKREEGREEEIKRIAIEFALDLAKQCADRVTPLYIYPYDLSKECLNGDLTLRSNVFELLYDSRRLEIERQLYKRIYRESKYTSGEVCEEEIDFGHCVYKFNIADNMDLIQAVCDEDKEAENENK